MYGRRARIGLLIPANNAVIEPEFARMAPEVVAVTDFRTIEAIEPLERDLGKPVVTNNQAIFWACLRRSGLTAPVEGYGRFLRDP